MDFGLAKPAQPMPDRTELTRTGAIAGTVRYMSPEQINGAALTPASDIYSLGIVIYEMVTGRVPFQADSLWAMISQHLNAAPPPPRQFAPNLDAKWETAILKCLKKNPAERFSYVEELKSALQLHTAPQAWKPTRRALIGTAVTAALGVAATQVRWRGLNIGMAPLPPQRYVALMIWPDMPPASLVPVLNSVMDAMTNRLTRAEKAVEKFVVVRWSELAGRTTPEPHEALYLLGANLVLAASLKPEAGKLALNLQVLESAGQKLLRNRKLLVAAPQTRQLPQTAAQAAADLLQLPDAPATRADQQLSKTSGSAYQAYSAAEEFMRRPNYSGVDDAIASYQTALEADPRFALAYARIARAYACAGARRAQCGPGHAIRAGRCPERFQQGPDRTLLGQDESSHGYIGSGGEPRPQQHGSPHGRSRRAA
jgi:hypothetical protein